MNSDLSLLTTFATNVGNACPIAFEVLFPQGDFVITARYREHVARNRPTDMPDDVLESMESFGGPV